MGSGDDDLELFETRGAQDARDGQPLESQKGREEGEGEKDVPPTDSPALALTITNSPTC